VRTEEEEKTEGLANEKKRYSNRQTGKERQEQHSGMKYDQSLSCTGFMLV
jgi:hypothetical protein